MSDQEPRRITRENASELSYVEMVKIGTTRLAPIQVGPAPLVIDTKEGEYALPVGWQGAIALDADGDPYPVAGDIIAKTYREVAVPRTFRERAAEALKQSESRQSGQGRQEARESAIAYGLLALVETFANPTTHVTPEER